MYGNVAISAQLEEQQLELARLAAALGRQPLEADPVARLLLAADEAARSTERADACSLPEGEVRTGPWPGCKAGGRGGGAGRDKGAVASHSGRHYLTRAAAPTMVRSVCEVGAAHVPLSVRARSWSSSSHSRARPMPS